MEVEAGKWASVYGAVYIFVDKPASNAGTRAEELQQAIRPYVSLVSPENVIDWKYERQMNGAMVLTYLKVMLGRTQDSKTYKIYTPEETVTLTAYNDTDTTTVTEQVPNALGEIPCVVLYNNITWQHGIGISDIADVSDIQRSIYSDYSEINSLIKHSNHPTLVKTIDTEASAGAGAIITMPPDMPGDLKPYLLTPSGQNISTSETINAKYRLLKMTHLDSVSGQKMSLSIAMLIEQSISKYIK